MAHVPRIVSDSRRPLVRESCPLTDEPFTESQSHRNRPALKSHSVGKPAGGLRVPSYICATRMLLPNSWAERRSPFGTPDLASRFRSTTKAWPSTVSRDICQFKSPKKSNSLTLGESRKFLPRGENVLGLKCVVSKSGTKTSRCGLVRFEFGE
jgi:hypothetical protein